jgi:hypothetical protein
MAVDIHWGHMFCTTADVHFGPGFDTDDECERFYYWLCEHHGNPRRIKELELVRLKAVWEAEMAKQHTTNAEG